MDLLPLVYDRNGALCALCLRRGPHADMTFAVEAAACANPLCPCAELTLHCTRMAHEPAACPAHLSIVLDLHRRSVVSSLCEGHPATEAVALAEELVREMGVEDWQDLHRRLYRLKGTQTENADCRRLHAVFPPDVLAAPSTMVTYKDVFVWGSAFEFTLEGARWMLYDQYCVNPACDCHEAVVTFLQVSVTPEGQASVIQEAPPALYDTARETFRPRRPPWKDQPALETLVHALRETYPGFAASMRNRRQQLRTLYQTAIERDRHASPPQAKNKQRRERNREKAARRARRVNRRR